MQNLNVINTIGQYLELFHVQSNTVIELPPNLSTILIGKPNEDNQPDIDVSTLPNSDIVSRNHAVIHVENETYYLSDTGSANGTFINDNKLEPHQRYQLNLGDKIDLGKDNQVTFILQYKPQQGQSVPKNWNPTRLQYHRVNTIEQTIVDRKTKVIGMALLFAGVVILAANTQVGVFVRVPGVLLCLAGVVLLMLRRFNPLFGWLAIALGIGVMVFTSNIFASVNLLAIIASSALIFAGYQLFTTGHVMGYGLRSLKGLLKK